MPELSEQELSAALKFEMEQYIPMPVDQVKTDWEILARKNISGKKTMDVMIVAAPLALLQKYEKVMEMAGLYPETIETEVVSVHRALLPLVNTKGASMIVHMGTNTTSIAAIREGRIKMISSVGVGGLALTRSISIDLGIDINQAENYKKAYGLSPNAFEGKIGKILAPVLASVSSDIKKAILAYREKNNNENIDQLILSGGTALLPGFDSYLTNALSAQVVVGRSWSAYGITNVPQTLVNEAPSYNVVMGLALRTIL
jgi:type IV pilus assembly protein PilM